MARLRRGRADAKLEVEGVGALRVDAAGRWLTARLEGGLYRRLVNGRAVVIAEATAPPEDVADPASLERRVASLAARLAARCPDELARGWLEAAAARDDQAWRQDALRFRAAYPEDVEILPPDRYRDVVVLPATGCPNGACTFCAFYRDRPLRALASDAFDRHLRAVAALFGPALPLRTGVFLGSASALSLSDRRLAQALAAIRAVLPRAPREVAAFWDPDHTPARDAAAWARLREQGLARAYIGLETGLGPLRAALGKSGDLDTLVARARFARQGGVTLGIIVLTGAAPHRAQEHLRATCEVVEALGLSRTDRVFVSPLERPGAPPADAREALQARQALAGVTAAQVVPYAMGQFRYYA